jgi:hypothetical protein
MTPERCVEEFEMALQRLKDFPDRLIIHELTCLADEYSVASTHLADSVVAKILDVSFALLNTCFCILNVRFHVANANMITETSSNAFRNLFIDVLWQRRTRRADKAPLFYLMDSILKFVGGPYVGLFSTHIAEVFFRAFDEVGCCVSSYRIPMPCL